MNNGTGNVVRTSSTWEKRARSLFTAFLTSYFGAHIDKLTPDPSPTQASESEPSVLTLKTNWDKRKKSMFVCSFLINNRCNTQRRGTDWRCKPKLVNTRTRVVETKQNVVMYHLFPIGK